MCSLAFEIRANVRFLVRLQWDQRRIVDAILEVYGEENTPPRDRLQEWIRQFRSGRDTLDDDPPISLQPVSRELCTIAQEMSQVTESQETSPFETEKVRQSDEEGFSQEKNINNLTAVNLVLNEKLDKNELKEDEVIEQLAISLNNQLNNEELNERHGIEKCSVDTLSSRQVAEEVSRLVSVPTGSLAEECRQAPSFHLSLQDQIDPIVLNDNGQIETGAVNNIIIEEEIKNEAMAIALSKRLEMEELDQLQAQELNNRMVAEELKLQLDTELDRLHAEELNNQLKAEELNKQELDEASAAKAMELVQESEECVPKEYMYEHLVAVYSEQKVVPNLYSFECPICFEECKENEGIILKECLHSFCRECIITQIKLSEEVDVKCPFRDDVYACSDFISENEILGLLTPEDYNSRLTKTLKFAEAQVEFSFHCRKADCTGWCIVEGGLNVFNCPVCSSENCLSCKVIHSGYTCSQYAESLRASKGSSEDVKKSETFLQSMVDTGTVMKCPKCSAFVQKIYGCDYLQCSVCKMDLCWATKGPRWGPAGHGDNSGGCGCKVNGRRCHINCQNCH